MRKYIFITLIFSSLFLLLYSGVLALSCPSDQTSCDAYFCKGSVDMPCDSSCPETWQTMTCSDNGGDWWCYSQFPDGGPSALYCDGGSVCFCAGSPPVTHLDCQSTACVSVSGSGINKCSSNVDCQICSPGATQSCVSGACGGVQTCASDGSGWGSCVPNPVDSCGGGTCGDNGNACDGICRPTDNCPGGDSSGNSCDSSCCVSNQGSACNRNVCGGSGTVNCNGSCSAAAPAMDNCPGGDISGSSCDGSCGGSGGGGCTDSCGGGDYSGSCTDGSCCSSSQGSACNRNVCGGSGIVNCDGSCSAAAPAVDNCPGGDTSGSSCDGTCGGAVPVPDLTADNVTPATATAGTAQTFSVVIRNSGGASTGGGFTNIFQTSPVSDGSSGVVDYPVAVAASLAAGGSVTITKVITFPSSGVMYIRACADKSSAGDTTGTIAEGTNEGNNCSSAWIAVTIAASASFTISPASFTFNATFNASAPAGQTLTITNTGSTVLNWTGSTDKTWCHITPSSGTINPGLNQSATVSVDSPVSPLIVGTNPCSVNVSD